MPHGAQVGPAELVGGVLDGAAQEAGDAAVGLEVGCRGPWRGLLLAPVLVGLAENLGVDELVAGGHEGLRRLALAETEDELPVLAEPGRDAREVRVARDDAEAVQVLRVEEVHGVDDHGAVRGVLARRVGELLDGLDGVLEELVLPGAQVGARPVPIDALDARDAVFRDLGEETLDDGGLGIVGVHEDGELELGLIGLIGLLLGLKTLIVLHESSPNREARIRRTEETAPRDTRTGFPFPRSSASRTSPFSVFSSLTGRTRTLVGSAPGSR